MYHIALTHVHVALHFPAILYFIHISESYLLVFLLKVGILPFKKVSLYYKTFKLN